MARSSLVLAVMLAVGLVAACGDDPEAPAATWQSVVAGHPSSFLGVWGSSADDVWLVGSDARDDAGDGLGPIIQHYDGTRWTRLDSGLRRIDLWWVYGFAGGPVFFGGTNGTVLRYQDGQFEQLDTPGTSIVFGIWGSSPTDVWVVGGQFALDGFAWHFDGATFTPHAVPEDLSGNAVWKVAGTGPDDVWMTAKHAVLHWDGQTLAREDVGDSEEQLFSIGVRDDVVVAAGGNLSNGRIYERDRAGGSWRDVTPDPQAPPWRGVAASADGVFAVGQDANVATRSNDDDAWSAEVLELTSDGFHAAWIDPDGALWAVGGKFDRFPPIDGVVVRKAPDAIVPIP